jgi:hypothetical protein
MHKPDWKVTHRIASPKHRELTVDPIAKLNDLNHPGGVPLEEGREDDVLEQ